MSNSEITGSFSCPIPPKDYERITMAHGGGGRLMNDLIAEEFVGELSNPLLDGMHDGAVFDVEQGKMAFSTDSFVVNPLFFPGGDIGKLAICGTVNDISMCGAKPLYLTLAFIIEEGFLISDLRKIISTIKETASKVPVQIVTGDTKVVEKGKGDGIFINTSGVGRVISPKNIGAKSIKKGDLILTSGDIGRHGLTIMCCRQGLDIDIPVVSDCRSLASTVEKLIVAGVDIHCMRDATRGGIASTLNELSASSGFSMEIEELKLPVKDEVKGACELLGLDPVYAANEGNFIMFISESDVAEALDILKSIPGGEDASVIGRVLDDEDHTVYLQNSLGLSRILDMQSGEQLPRIC